MPSKFGNAFMSWMINSPLGGMMGEGMAVITVKGRKTGKPISTPINVMRDGEVYTIISSRERTWWRNLRGGAEARLRSGGKTFQVNGEVFESETDLKVKLAEFLRKQPMVARYIKVRTTADGSLNEADLNLAISERVLIQLKPLA